MNRQIPLLVGVGLANAALGLFVGYKIAEKRLVEEYKNILDKELEETRNFYAISQKGAFPTPADALEALQEDRGSRLSVPAGEALRKYTGDKQDSEHQRVAYHKIGKVEAAETPQASGLTEYDYAIEIPLRKEGYPYVIPKDDFFQNELDYEQITLTYYVNDDTLAEVVSDDVVDNVDDTVGRNFHKKFGHGSGDPEVVYVRNDKLSVDYEITRSTVSYKEEVLGYTDTEGLSNSYEPMPRRRRRLGD